MSDHEYIPAAKEAGPSTSSTVAWILRCIESAKGDRAWVAKLSLGGLEVLRDEFRALEGEAKMVWMARAENAEARVKDLEEVLHPSCTSQDLAAVRRLRAEEADRAAIAWGKHRLSATKPRGKPE